MEILFQKQWLPYVPWQISVNESAGERKSFPQAVLYLSMVNLHI